MTCCKYDRCGSSEHCQLLSYHHAIPTSTKNMSNTQQWELNASYILTNCIFKKNVLCLF